MGETTYFAIEEWEEFCKIVREKMPDNADNQKSVPIIAALLVVAHNLKGMSN